MHFQLRCAQRQDLAQILSIYNAEIQMGTANWGEQEKSLADFQHWFEQLNAQNFPLFVAEDLASQKIAGYADYAPFRAISGFKHSVEHSVFIDPEFTRQGLGQALMLKLIEHARQHHIHVMIAAIDSENQGSILLHKKLGFLQTGYLPQVGQKFGQWRNLIFMQLILD